MTAAAIGDVLARRHNPDGTIRRTFQPVRRHSYDIEDKRAKPWAPAG